MAFEKTPKKTKTKTVVHQFKYWRSIIVCGSFLVLCLILSYFQKPIQTSFHNWRVARENDNTVQLPPILIASPALTPSPAATPNLVPIVVTSPTPTPAPAVAAGSHLPKTGPDTSVEIILAAAGIAGASYAYQKRQHSLLKKSAESIHIL